MEIRKYSAQQRGIDYQQSTGMEVYSDPANCPLFFLLVFSPDKLGSLCKKNEATIASRVSSHGFFANKTSFGAKGVAEESFQLNRFHQASKNLPEEAQQNIRILRRRANSKGWRMKHNPHGGPEIWGVEIDGKIDWRLKIKPEVSPRAGSDFPRFDARLNSGKNPNTLILLQVRLVTKQQVPGGSIFNRQVDQFTTATDIWMEP